ncbi:hypothetical protein PtA15_10A372 [Puccinia triticina]|uniref:Uncharacterized protein n=1 Tax=Puccinia triticina TaxID=208348 RepID=A0ABY7CUG7_9BASI|nr:uncharacterized protein PtA15_10A372 [Puccinia triticina]WAQ88949.1 hypothetical protein PtA15_10A372 [Puccinia triticina]WAR59000.1 hypothetical protein PtB15_10B342 [Puccinia triticina]
MPTRRRGVPSLSARSCDLAVGCGSPSCPWGTRLAMGNLETGSLGTRVAARGGCGRGPVHTDGRGNVTQFCVAPDGPCSIYKLFAKGAHSPIRSPKSNPADELSAPHSSTHHMFSQKLNPVMFQVPKPIMMLALVLLACSLPAPASSAPGQVVDRPLGLESRELRCTCRLYGGCHC